MEKIHVLKIEISDTCAAMDDDKFNETARMLRKLADRIERDQEWPSSMWGIFDLNGNGIGHADTIMRRIE